LIPQYIVFHNANEDRVSAVCYIGLHNHDTIWQYLHRQDSNVFYRPLSAGYTYFRTRAKKFVATGDSSTLSLVPHEDDGKVLQEALGQNDKLKLIVTNLDQGPDFGFLLGTRDDLLSCYFDQASIFGEGKATFRIQDSTRPFKFDVSAIKGGVAMQTQYVTYMEDRLVA
jgi:hypothetical protein